MVNSQNKENIDSVTMECFFYILLYSIPFVCGKNEISSSEVWHWLNKQQSQCFMGRIFSQQQFIKHYYHCILDKTSACIHDMTDYHQQPQQQQRSTIYLRYFCGCIITDRIQQVSSLQWHIHTATNVRLHFEEFSLAHYNWECKQEWLQIDSSIGVDKLCGKRLPWKQDLPGPDIFIILQAGNEVMTGHFLLFYYMLTKLWRVKHVVRTEIQFQHDVTTTYHYPDFTVNDEVCLHYLGKVKLHPISLNVFHRTEDVVQVAVICYDGPGSKSPRLTNDDVVQSEKEPFFVASTYQMYCKFSKKQNYSSHYQIYSVVSLMFSFAFFDDLYSNDGRNDFGKYNRYDPLPFIQVSKDEADFSVQFDAWSLSQNKLYQLDINRDSLFKEHFYYPGRDNSSDAQIHSMFTLQLTLSVFDGFLSHMIVEGGHCVYGGLFVISYYKLQNLPGSHGATYMNAKQEKEEELWHLCTRFKNNDIPIYIDGGVTKLLILAYKGYLDGRVNIKGTIKIRENYSILNQKLPRFLVKYFKRGMDVLTGLELTDEKNIHFVLQPLVHSLYLSSNFQYMFKRKGFPEHTSETLILTFEYFGNCAYCYVEYDSNLSQFVKIPDGKKMVHPVSSSSKKYSGTIESNVKVLTVNQSNCQTPQMWTLYFKYFTNYDISNAWNAHKNWTYPLTLPYSSDFTETIWSYSQYSTRPTSFVLALQRNPTYSETSSICHVKFDTMCLITAVFVEQVINTTDGFIYRLYKWQNKSEIMWLSGCDHCNIILVADPARIPSSCDKTIKYVDRTFIKRYYTVAESLQEKNKTGHRRNFKSYGIRYDKDIICPS